MLFNQPTIEQKRLYFIDVVRAFAILMMLQGHFIESISCLRYSRNEARQAFLNQVKSTIAEVEEYYKKELEEVNRTALIHHPTLTLWSYSSARNEASLNIARLSLRHK